MSLRSLVLCFLLVLCAAAVLARKKHSHSRHAHHSHHSLAKADAEPRTVTSHRKLIHPLSKMKADLGNVANIPAAQIAATKDWSLKWLTMLKAAPQRPLCYPLAMPDSRSVLTSQLTSEVEKVDKWRCQGCMNTVVDLVKFMKPLLDRGDYKGAFQEFGAVCQYINPEFTSLCQNMFETLPTDIPSMIVQEVMPVDICSCYNFCRVNERDIYMNAFKSITADETTAPALPAFPQDANSKANNALNKAMQQQIATLSKAQPPRPQCYANSQYSRVTFGDATLRSVTEQTNKWRCDGCIESVQTLFNHIKPVLSRGGSVKEAAEEFGRACQNVKPEFVEACQYLFEVYPDQVIGMIFKDIIPLDICVCVQNCRANERDYYTRAFATLSTLQTVLP